MDLIVTHHMAGFDALACAVAARRIYAGATIALPSRLAPEVRDYLTIHRDRFPAESSRDVDQERVRRLICVDVRQRSRLRDFGRVLERIDAADPRLNVVVWDHHAAHADDLPADEEHVAQTGAAVTLLIEAIDARGLHVDPEEATLFALGIHAETDSLSHHNATSRDAKALAWTMERGASQAVIDRYLNPPLSPGQRAALAGVLSHVQPEVIDGVPVGIAVVLLRAHVDGLSVVTWHASRFERYAAVVVLYVVKDTRLQVIGRARSPVLDLGRLPVLERGELVGIITRTDIREALYLPNDGQRTPGGVA